MTWYIPKDGEEMIMPKDIKHINVREDSWREDSPSEAQIRYLAYLSGEPEWEFDGWNKGQVSDKIDELKAEIE